MADSTPIILMLDSDAAPAPTGELAKAFLELGVEATLMMSASTARGLTPDHPLTEAARTLDVGLNDRELADPEASTPSLFQPCFEKLHDAVLFPTGRLPSVYSCPSLALGSYATLSEVNVRAVIAPMALPSAKPFFLGGRLHLPPPIAIEKLKDDADVETAFHRLQTEASKEGGAGAVAVALPHPPNLLTKAAITQFLKRLLETTSLKVCSARQLADLYADIPYDLAIPMTAITEMAAHAAKGDPTPFPYAVGWLSPAEQLFILAHIWSVTLEKGKAPRNSQARTPIPTLDDSTESTATTISAAEFPSLIGKLVASMQNKNELPTGVALEAGTVAAQDLLPTLAASLSSLPTPTDLVVKRGAAAFAPELVGFKRLAWTYKPAMR